MFTKFATTFLTKKVRPEKVQLFASLSLSLSLASHSLREQAALPAEQLSAVLHREFADMLVSESLTSFVDQIVAKLASTRAHANSSNSSSNNTNKRALDDGTTANTTTAADAVDEDDDDDDERNEAEHDFKRSRTRSDERDSNRSPPPPPVGAPGPGGVVDVQPLRRYEREREPRDRRDREPSRDAPRDWNHARGGAPMGAFPLGFQFGLPGNPLFNFRPLYGGPQPMAPYPQQWMPNHQPPHYPLQPHEQRRDDRDRQGRDRGGDRGGGQRDRAGPSSASSSSSQQPPAKRGFGTHNDKNDPILADANLPTTLVLTRVPQNLNSLSQLMGHFSKFGEIEGIKCDKATDRATIEFRTRAGAQAAISSTDAVLNNRFIMVFWANREPPSETGTRARAAPAQKLNAVTKPGSNVLIVSAPANAAASGATATAGAGADATDGAAALERKQLELLKMRETIRQTQMSQQKQILSLVSRPGIADDEKAALMLKLKELSAAIEESLALEREAANTTAERVAVATATAVERANASRATANAAKFEAEAATQSSTAATAITTTNTNTVPVDPKLAAINAQLAALERQVLGVGGAAAAASSPPAYGGRGRGRGAPSWHGRGRGGGGAVGAPPRRMRLDLRGTTIVLSGASDDVAANEEAVRNALAPYGGIVKNVLLGQPGGVVVDYETVHDAERVINAVNGTTGAPFTARWNVAAAKAVESSNDAGAAAAGTAPVSDASFDAGVEVTEYKAGREAHDDEEGDDEDAWRR